MRTLSSSTVRLSITFLGISSAIVAIQFAGALQVLEWAVLDHWFRLRPLDPPTSRILIVAIQESDLEHLGQWPISDLTLATLLEKLKQHQPRAIGLDLYRNLPVQPGHKALQHVFETTPNLIGIEKVVNDQAGSAVEPAPQLRQLNQTAASDLVLDSDGTLRRNLLSIRITAPVAANATTQPPSRTVLTLGAKLALMYLKVEGIQPQQAPDNPSVIRLGQITLHPLQSNDGGYAGADVGGYQLLSNYLRPQAGITTVTLSDVLADRVPSDLIHGRIVLIGSQAASLGDRIYTPFTNSVQTTWSGVEIHANMALQLITAALDRRSLVGLPESLKWIWVSVWAALGIITTVWLYHCNPRYDVSLRRMLLAITLLSLGLVGLTYGLFLAGWWIPLVSPLLALTTAGAVSRSVWTWQRLEQSHRILESYSKNLEQKVQERTQELIEKNAALEESRQVAETANHAKSTFLANINHELRTPLTTILLCSELLKEGENLTVEQQQDLNTIDQSVHHLLALINNVLDLSKMEAGAATLDAEVVQLKPLLETIVDMFRLHTETKEIAFHCQFAPDLPQAIYIDGGKLRQILINLLSNAVKFTQHGSISLLVAVKSPTVVDPEKYSLQDPRSCLHIEVQDTGIGISPDDLEKIFEAFVQTSVGRKSHEGTGLGLAICQQFIQLMGGEIEVKSKINQGSCFTLTIPMQILEVSAESEDWKYMSDDRGLGWSQWQNDQELTHKLQTVMHEMPREWRDEFHAAAISLNAERCLILMQDLPSENSLQLVQSLIYDYRFDVLIELTTSH